MKKRLLSGMRPTGPLHLGHRVGALNNWAKLQDEYECFFMVADWHAHMSEYERPREICKYTIDNVIDWLSCYPELQNSTIFVQSHVPEHAQLHLILSNITPLGWLERCPTYKDQLREIKTRDLHTYGFLGYPVLQSADILLYKANVVPVGQDQLAHLELTREIARRFHHIYKKKIFPEPVAKLSKTPKLLGIDNRKMSKSYANFIALSDLKDVVEKKCAQMITDTNRIKRSDPGDPDVCNVYSYFQAFSRQSSGEVQEHCELAKKCCEQAKSYCPQAKLGCTECKKKLADLLNKILEPIRARRLNWQNNIKDVEIILSKGAEKARAIAGETLAEVKELVGLY